MNQHVLNHKTTFINTLLGKGKVSGGLAFEEKLHAQWFDFSLESLYYMDSYLMSVFVVYDELDERQIENTIWAVGFYVGEVIRRSSDKNYRWKHWDEFFLNQDADMQDHYFKTMGTSALLVAGDKSFILPINQVIKFLKEGPENSLHFFASRQVEPANV